MVCVLKMNHCHLKQYQCFLVLKLFFFIIPFLNNRSIVLRFGISGLSFFRLLISLVHTFSLSFILSSDKREFYMFSRTVARGCIHFLLLELVIVWVKWCTVHAARYMWMIIKRASFYRLSIRTVTEWRLWMFQELCIMWSRRLNCQAI